MIPVYSHANRPIELKRRISADASTDPSAAIHVVEADHPAGLGVSDQCSSLAVDRY